VLNTCRHILNAFRFGRDAGTSAKDNLMTYALAEACYEAAATGKAVKPQAYG
jgi:predicted dehydrogenase